MKLTLRRDLDVPLYQQIVNQVRDGIRAGSLPPGYRLPPVRRVAADHGLTRLTVHSAYSELQAQGLVESHVGRGTFVAPDARAIGSPGRVAEPPGTWASQGVLADLLRMSQQRGLISFAQAFPAADTYPRKELQRGLRLAAGRAEAWDYGPIHGEAELRDQVAALLLDRGVSVPPEHMLVTSGAQQGIDLTLHLVAPGEVILVEEPVYPGVLELAAQRGVRVIGVPADEGGLRLDAVEAACRDHQPRLLYCVPTFGNPTGISLAPERREPLVRLARAHDLLLLEDDVYGFISFDQPAPAALKSLDRDGQVVYLTSFSKILTPGLRLGVLAAPPALLPRLAAAKHGSDLVCSALLQQTLADYLRRGYLPGHIQKTRTLYAERRNHMIAALSRYLPECSWTYPAGGLSLWVRLPDGIVERDFVADAIEEGVGVAAGRAFFPKSPPYGAMRISFGMHSPEQIEQGVAALGRVLRRHQERQMTMLSLAGRRVGPLV